MQRPRIPPDAFRSRAGTPSGQAAGLALLTLPALANPLPLGPAGHAVVQLLAVVLGFAGAVVVFGGMAVRVLLPGDRPLDDVLPRVPHGRAAWWVLVALVVLLLVGAEWRLVLIFTDEWSRHLPEVVMLVLPAAALGRLAWRTRALRTGEADEADEADEVRSPG